MDVREFDKLLERVNQSRKAALQDHSFIEQAEMHAKELARIETMRSEPTKKRSRTKAKGPKRFSNVYEGFASNRELDFHY
ncbi:hypothetical protein LRP49_02385 [Enterovibrio sp. ZSDZ35]|uniref:Transposase n=1 Tax=Enterovibrio qingdaonensis TaxID=2899818 RepID=A0ABT5QGD7_9GAMM|nr:hypothetical protein [Enterovibrio sp. ZSDZ35]MDD1780036.1 hypothetical protein [Enterovibrio sp. ZSDZ35]